MMGSVFCPGKPDHPRFGGYESVFFSPNTTDVLDWNSQTEG